MDPRAGLDGCGISHPPPTRIRSLDLPARIQSLYRLSYRGPQTCTAHEIEARYTNSVSIVQMKVPH